MSAGADGQGSVAGPLAGRRLTAGEVTLLRGVFHDSVDYEVIRLRKGSVLTLFAGAVTLDNKVNFNPKSYFEDFSAAWRSDQSLLVHEVVHVWQFQRKVRNYRWTKAAWEHLRYGKDAYKYELNPNKALTDYRFEQMGQLVQDYYLLPAGHPPRAAYEAVIYRSISRPPG